MEERANCRSSLKTLDWIAHGIFLESSDQTMMIEELNLPRSDLLDQAGALDRHSAAAFGLAPCWQVTLGVIQYVVRM